MIRHFIADTYSTVVQTSRTIASETKKLGHTALVKEKVYFHKDLQSSGGKTLITACSSWIAGGGGEAVGRM